MIKKTKKDLSITLGVNAAILIATFAVFAAVSKYFMDMSAEIMSQIPWLFIVAIFGLAIGVFVVAFSLPLLFTAAIQLSFIPILLTCKRDKDMNIATMILLILTVIFAVISLSAMTILVSVMLYFFSSSSPVDPAIIFTLVTLLVLSAISVIACTITVIVYYTRLHRYCKKAKLAQTTSEQPVAFAS